MRNCPFTDCGKPIPSDRFACPRHWFSLTKDQQARIWAAYRAWQRGTMSIGELCAEQAEVVADAEGVTF